MGDWRLSSGVQHPRVEGMEQRPVMLNSTLPLSGRSVAVYRDRLPVPAGVLASTRVAGPKDPKGVADAGLLGVTRASSELLCAPISVCIAIM